ncbi:MAG: hypothetical protein Unbinned2514contig1000_5 [Prokaryotic dsDNA virus sp.]|nr:MAG: hypothetical protein Unbinned2514contig1000_5 [Prokaryotic dsDNA virus sp.]|tara:strand:+ start:2484 stop:2801 length:318 start_codon:yes stop_codon:yes gene_type:complete
MSEQLNIGPSKTHSLPNSSYEVFTYTDETESDLFIKVDGAGDYHSHTDGFPIIVSRNSKGEVKLYVYSDINQEEPTHEICLNGALASNRRLEDSDNTTPTMENTP